MLWIGKGGGSIEGCNLNRAVLAVDEKQYRTNFTLHHEIMYER